MSEAGAAAVTLARAAPEARRRHALGRLAGRNRLAIVGALALLLAVSAALLAPWLPLADPDAVDTPNRLRPPLTAGHTLGTDEFGRDLLARLVWGARVSLTAGALSAAAAMLIGVALGVLGGFYTGWIETVVMRLTDILMAFPYVLLAIAIVAGLGPGLRNAMVAIAIVGFPFYTRLVRGVVLSDPPLFALVPEATEQLARQRQEIEEAVREGGPQAGVEAWLGGRVEGDALARARASYLGFFADFAGLASWPATRREIRSLAHPAVVLTGPGSPPHVIAAADRLAELLPNARRVHDGDLGAAVAKLPAGAPA